MTQPAPTITADYVIVGSGAMGMAFADTILSETDATIAIIDRYHKPGGHWNVAYPFVTLHQPSAFYGVNSKELSSGETDKSGLNKGLGHLASGAQVQAYFDDIMRQDFLPSGRVKYFPMCVYEENGQFRHILTGDVKIAKANRKIVDCTFLKTSVPSTHTPSFTCDEGVNFVPLNDLPQLNEAPEGFVVIGGGKTGIDACLWLLEHNVPPEAITWIISRDSWWLNRKNTQPTMEFFEDSLGAQANQFEAIALSTSMEDMFSRLEACGYFLRLDPNHRPSIFHGATISEAELDALRQIPNIVRMGRVSHIGRDEIVLRDGRIPTSQNHIHIDCSARAITNDTIKPVFESGMITPQMVRSYQPVFSAAFIAHVEASYDTNEEKNDICKVVPVPDTDADFVRFTLAFMANQLRWSQDKNLRAWLRESRLDGFARLVASVDKEDTAKQAILQKMRENAMPAAMKLQTYLQSLDV